MPKEKIGKRERLKIVQKAIANTELIQKRKKLPSSYKLKLQERSAGKMIRKISNLEDTQERLDLRIERDKRDLAKVKNPVKRKDMQQQIKDSQEVSKEITKEISDTAEDLQKKNREITREKQRLNRKLIQSQSKGKKLDHRLYSLVN